MASVTFNPPSVVIPPGGFADVELVWQLNPGTPDKVGTFTVTVDGQEYKGTAIVDGPDGEAIPELITSGQSTTGKALITSDVANIQILDNTHVRLTAKQA